METTSTKLFISGDFYGGDRAGSRVEEKFGAGEFAGVFGEFTEIIRASDIAVTNLESPVITSGKPIVKTGPLLKSSPATMDALSFAGFDLVTLANNHILDYGLEGLCNTIELLDKYNIKHVGASPHRDLASVPYITEINSKKIAFLNFSENEWSTVTREHSGANPLDPVSNHYDIAETRKSCDYLVVVLHGGNEYYNLPNPRTKEICRFYIDSGADLVVCHHAHCYSGFEDYKQGRIYYGLGNFLFDKPGSKDSSWSRGLAVQVEISEDRIKHSLIPYKQCETRPVIELLTPDERKEFEDNISRLGEIIQDNEKLQSSFDSFTASKQKQYEAFLQPYGGKFRSLYKKGLLPPILTDRYYTLLLNLIRCESHRDVITDILSKRISTSGSTKN